MASDVSRFARYFPLVSVLNVPTTRVTHGAGESWPHARTFTFALEFLPGTGTSALC